MLHGVTSIGAYNQPNDQREETENFSIIYFVIKQNWAQPGFKPGTSRTQSENHTPRKLSFEIVDPVKHLKTAIMTL